VSLPFYGILIVYIAFLSKDKYLRFFRVRSILSFILIILMSLIVHIQNYAGVYGLDIPQAGFNKRSILLFIASSLPLAVAAMQKSGIIAGSRKIFYSVLAGVPFFISVIDILLSGSLISFRFYIIILSAATISAYIVLGIIAIFYLMRRFGEFGREFSEILAARSGKIIIFGMGLCGILLWSFMSGLGRFHLWLSFIATFAAQTCFFIWEMSEKYRVKSYVSGERNKEKSYPPYVEEKGACEDYRVITRLVDFFEEKKPYLKTDLKMEEVARNIYTNRSYLSKALNTRVSKNFNQFVNYYRVREACLVYLRNPNMPVPELCKLSGFKTVPSFSTAFKINTGYTPGLWCREINDKLEHKEEISISEYFL
jgi:AraC-like DNA-binding protein